MRDVLGNELRRGDRITDPGGEVFMVTGVSPATVHLQNVKTGRRYTVGPPQLLKLPPRQRDGKPEMVTQKERANYFRKLTAGRRR